MANHGRDASRDTTKTSGLGSGIPSAITSEVSRTTNRSRSRNDNQRAASQGGARRPVIASFGSGAPSDVGPPKSELGLSRIDDDFGTEFWGSAKDGAAYGDANASIATEADRRESRGINTAQIMDTAWEPRGLEARANLGFSIQPPIRVNHKRYHENLGTRGIFAEGEKRYIQLFIWCLHRRIEALQAAESQKPEINSSLSRRLQLITALNTMETDLITGRMTINWKSHHKLELGPQDRNVENEINRVRLQQAESTCQGLVAANNRLISLLRHWEGQNMPLSSVSKARPSEDRASVDISKLLRRGAELSRRLVVKIAELDTILTGAQHTLLVAADNVQRKSELALISNRHPR